MSTYKCLSSAWVCLVLSGLGTLLAQESAEPAAPEPRTWTTEEDHRNMMAQLGIRKLRPGPSGNENAPNHANYDEAMANPYPNLPDVLTLKNGKKVTTAQMWWKQRRPEIVEDFEREVFGRVPRNVPKVRGRSPKRPRRGRTYPVDRKAARGPRRQLLVSGHQRGYPDDSGHAKGCNGPSSGDDDVRIRRPASGLVIGGPGGTRIWPAARRRSARHATTDCRRLGLRLHQSHQRTGRQRRRPDQGHHRSGQQGPAPQAGRLGRLRAWAWGASRGLDYLETDKAVDAKHVGIEGVSRYGKAALVTMAFDTRFALVLVGSSGEGGAKLHRRNWGEAVENLTGSGEYHWMAGNFLKYGAAEADFGSKNAGDLPVDAHELIALCAPRLTFISYGVPEKGDAKWLDQQGSFMAAVAAGPVFRLLGAKDLGTSEDYRTAKMPPVNTGLLDGQLAWRQHDGGHTDGPNWKYFIHGPTGSSGTHRRLRRIGLFPRTDQNSQTAHAQLLERPGKAESTSISRATPSHAAGVQPITRHSWPTGNRISSAGTRPISDGAATPRRTSCGASTTANWTGSIRRSSSCWPAPTTSAIRCPRRR